MVPARLWAVNAVVLALHTSSAPSSVLLVHAVTEHYQLIQFTRCSLLYTPNFQQTLLTSPFSQAARYLLHYMYLAAVNGQSSSRADQEALQHPSCCTHTAAAPRLLSRAPLAAGARH